MGLFSRALPRAQIPDRGQGSAGLIGREGRAGEIWGKRREEWPKGMVTWHSGVSLRKKVHSGRERRVWARRQGPLL